LLQLCTQELSGEEPRPLSPARRDHILQVAEAQAADALRLLGVAFRSLVPEIPRGLPPVGLMS